MRAFCESRDHEKSHFSRTDGSAASEESWKSHQGGQTGALSIKQIVHYEEFYQTPAIHFTSDSCPRA
jgi:hypothetical protein